MDIDKKEKNTENELKNLIGNDSLDKTTPIFTPFNFPSLTVIFGEKIGKKYFLNKEDTIFGRSEECDVVIDDLTISRKHMRIFRKNDKFYIEDLGSTNGSYVNGKEIHEIVKLQNGDIIGIGNIIFKFSEISFSYKNYWEEIYQFSTIDPITGVYNKSYFIDILDREISRSIRYKHDLSVILLELYDIEKIMEKYDLEIFYSILINLSKLINKIIRKQDLLARYSNTIFSILFPETNAYKTYYAACRLKRVIEENSDIINNKTQIFVSINVGIASLKKDISTVYTLLREADENLFIAKKSKKPAIYPEFKSKV